MILGRLFLSLEKVVSENILYAYGKRFITTQRYQVYCKNISKETLRK